MPTQTDSIPEALPRALNRVTRSYKCPVFRPGQTIECMAGSPNAPILGALPFYVLCGVVGAMLWRQLTGQKATAIRAVDVVGLLIAAFLTDLVIRTLDIQEIDLAAFVLMPVIWGSLIMALAHWRKEKVGVKSLALQWVATMVVMIGVSATGL